MGYFSMVTAPGMPMPGAVFCLNSTRHWHI